MTRILITAGYIVACIMLLDLVISTFGGRWSWTTAIFWAAVFMFIGPWINPFKRRS